MFFSIDGTNKAERACQYLGVRCNDGYQMVFAHYVLLAKLGIHGNNCLSATREDLALAFDVEVRDVSRKEDSREYPGRPLSDEILHCLLGRQV